MKIEGKVAVVTGAASGLGLASACALAEAGAHVVAIDLDEGRMGRLRESIAPDRLLTQAASVADESSVAAAIAAGVERARRKERSRAAIGRIVARRERAPGVTEASFRKSRDKGRP